MFCYEYGYLLLDGDEVLLVKREESWCANNLRIWKFENLKIVFAWTGIALFILFIL
jgi:hypothetical protein